MSLPLELRTVSRRCLLAAAVAGVALGWIALSAGMEQSDAAGVDRAEALAAVWPFAALAFVLGAGAAIGAYMAIKLLFYVVFRENREPDEPE